MRRHFHVTGLILIVGLALPLRAVDPDRDFSGKWVLDPVASNLRALGQVEPSLSVSQSPSAMMCSAGSAQWTYPLDGSETRRKVGEEIRNSMTKWEGAVLLVNILVSGPQNYTVSERWKLSRDRNTLTITRQELRAGLEAEGALVFRREGAPVEPSRPASRESAPMPMLRPTAPAADNPQTTLAKRPEPGLPPDVTVPTGTRVLLALVNEVSTKHAREGDKVYLRTAVPVAVDSRIVIPRNSDVVGTITRTKPAGRVAGKGELFIRFDSLILPNGVVRDFQARPSGEEGQVQGNGRAADSRTVMAGTGMGVTVGAISKGLPGAAVGGAVGALAGVLLSRNQDVVLRRGAHLEMVLDRDLVFHPDELQVIR